jgi:hypothetical protein
VTSSNWPSSPRLQRYLQYLGWGGLFVYIGLLLMLYLVWYSQSKQTGFHFFDDSAQWLQMDKYGHCFTAFHLSWAVYSWMVWAGATSHKASWQAAGIGFLLMLPIEILDGFSASYGFSWADVAANALGAFLFSAQIRLMGGLKLLPKFSFHPTAFAPQRPNVLGNGWSQEWLKDYNGQTYWLSIPLGAICKTQHWFTNGICLSIGLGAEQMIYARNPENWTVGLTPYRQLYVGIDFDLRAIPVQHTWLFFLFRLLNLLKCPLPAFEWAMAGGSFLWHTYYF